MLEVKETLEVKNWLEAISTHASTEFLGYENLSSKGRIEKIIKENSFVPKASSGEKVGIVLNKTCLYAESGSGG